MPRRKRCFGAREEARSPSSSPSPTKRPSLAEWLASQPTPATPSPDKSSDAPLPLTRRDFSPPALPRQALRTVQVTSSHRQPVPAPTVGHTGRDKLPMWVQQYPEGIGEPKQVFLITGTCKDVPSSGPSLGRSSLVPLLLTSRQEASSSSFVQKVIVEGCTPGGDSKVGRISLGEACPLCDIIESSGGPHQVLRYSIQELVNKMTSVGCRPFWKGGVFDALYVPTNLQILCECDEEPQESHAAAYHLSSIMVPFDVVAFCPRSRNVYYGRRHIMLPA